MRCYHNSIQKSIVMFTYRLVEQKQIIRMKVEFVRMASEVVYSNDQARATIIRTEPLFSGLSNDGGVESDILSQRMSLLN
jgi:hypothetical protein